MDTALPALFNPVAPALGAAPPELRQLEVGDFSRVSPLFAPPYPNLAFVRAVLEGTLPGRVFARWEGRRASACLIVTGSPFCFVAGAMPPRLFEDVLIMLATRPPITLVGPAGPELAALARARGFVATERLEFGGVSPADARQLSVAVPYPYELVEIDVGLFAQVNWKEMVHGIFGAAEAYVAHHYGFGLLHEGRLVAEAHGVVGGGLVEYGICTHPEHRRRGLSTVVVRQLMRHGGQLGHRAVATCVAGKTESQRSIALSGMRLERSYRAFTLPRCAAARTEPHHD